MLEYLSFSSNRIQDNGFLALQKIILNGWGGWRGDNNEGMHVAETSGFASPFTSQIQNPHSANDHHHVADNNDGSNSIVSAGAASSPHLLHSPIFVPPSDSHHAICTLRVIVLNECFLSPASFSPLMELIKASKGEGGLAAAGGDSTTHSNDKIPLELLCIKNNIFTEVQKTEMSYVAHRRCVFIR